MPGNVHISRPLTNISVSYVMDQKLFLAPQLFPFVGVDKDVDQYYVWDISDLLRIVSEKLEGDAVAPTRHTRLSTDSYACDIWGVRESIDEATRARADEATEIANQLAETVTQDMLMRNELNWFSEHFAAGKWTTDWDGVDSSSPSTNELERFDRSGSKLFEPLRNWISAQELLTGGGWRMTDMVMGAEVWDVVKEHPEALDKLKHTQKGIVGTDLIASALEIKRVHVSRAGYNTANQGATKSISRFAGKSILGLYVTDSPGRRVPTAGYSFGWKLFGGNNVGSRIRRYTVEERGNSEYIEGKFANDHKCVAPDLGAFIDTAVN